MQNVQNSLSLESLDNSIIISDKKYKILAGQTRRRNCSQNVCDPEALPDLREADPGGGHVPRELQLAEGRAPQQTRN